LGKLKSVLSFIDPSSIVLPSSYVAPFHHEISYLAIDIIPTYIDTYVVRRPLHFPVHLHAIRHLGQARLIVYTNTDNFSLVDDSMYMRLATGISSISCEVVSSESGNYKWARSFGSLPRKGCRIDR
jgi:hypothetical protein